MKINFRLLTDDTKRETRSTTANHKFVNRPLEAAFFFFLRKKRCVNIYYRKGRQFYRLLARFFSALVQWPHKFIHDTETMDKFDIEFSVHFAWAKTMKNKDTRSKCTTLTSFSSFRFDVIKIQIFENVLTSNENVDKRIKVTALKVKTGAHLIFILSFISFLFFPLSIYKIEFGNFKT